MKFNCQWSPCNHWTPSNWDGIQMKTEISLQRRFYYGSSKFPNRPHPNRRQLLQKDKAVQACHEQHVKINGTTVLKNEKDDFWNHQNCSNPQGQQQQRRKSRLDGWGAKFVHKICHQTPPDHNHNRVTRQQVIGLQKGWFEALQINSQQVIFSDGKKRWYCQFLLKAKSVNTGGMHSDFWYKHCLYCEAF